MTTLNELLEMAHQQARRVLIGKAGEQLTPLWHLINEDGEEKVIGTPFDGEAQKRILCAYMRQFMAENHVVRYSFLSEGWAVMLPKGIDHKTVERPVNHPDRREMVMAFACDREQTLSRWWFIKRDRRGRVTALPEEVMDRNSPMLGLFDNLLARSN